jgi:prepilin peptidase CpaA
MHSFAFWPTCIVLVVASFTDLRTHRIPNWLVFPFFLAGVATSWWLHGMGGIGRSLDGLLLGILIYGLFFLMGGIGAGDVKLCAAIGAWIGPEQLFMAMVVAGIAGGIMVVFWALLGGFAEELFTGTSNFIFGWRSRGTLRDPALVLSNPLKRRMPYAPAIAIGTIFSFFAG